MPLSSSATFIVLCGKTGSGKSQLLQQLETSGYPVINLERIASHRGSAFGALLLPPQPSQKDFENEIKKAVFKHASAPYIFIEQKPSSLGKRKIPTWLWSKMNDGIIVQLNVDKKTRVNNILKEYKTAGKENFINALRKLHQRLTITIMKQMETLLHEENYEAFVEKMLDYYDNTSKYQLPEKTNIILEEQPGYVADRAQQLLELLRRSGIGIQSIPSFLTK